MQDLTVTLVQSDLIWEDKEANLRRFDEKLTGVGKTGIIILPEMFNTGFSMKPEIFAEEEEGATLAWMQKKAAEKQAVLTGSFMVKEDGRHYNRLFFVLPDGSYATYDKRHLFRMGGEDLHFTPGREDVIVDYRGWKIKFLICYDLRFPVWAKNNYRDGRYEYDLLLVVANWPAVRSRVWKTLLSARAIENQVYAIGVNRMGNDGNGLPHSGNSNLYDPKGLPVLEDRPDQEFVETLTLSGELLTSFREKFTVGLDWDRFSIDKNYEFEKSGNRFSDRKSQTGYDG